MVKKVFGFDNERFFNVVCMHRGCKKPSQIKINEGRFSKFYCLEHIGDGFKDEK